MPYEYGRIVLARIPDGNGNLKLRPGVVLSSDDPLILVAISTQVDDPIPHHHVPLPWSLPRHPRTGLNRPNVAKCDWLATVPEAEIIKAIGFVPSAKLSEIEAALKALSGDKD